MEKNNYFLLRIQECLDEWDMSVYLTKINFVLGY